MQNDLFEIPMNSSVNLGVKQSSEKPAFLERYRMNMRLDQAVAGTIILIMIYVLVFSFGVEKGKRFAMEELKSERTKRDHMVNELRDKLIQNGLLPASEVSAVNLNKPVSLVVAASSQAVATKPVVQQVTPVQAILPKDEGLGKDVNVPVNKEGFFTVPEGKYTIQIVTYKAQSAAERGARDLSEKGLQGFLIQKGSYWELCSQSFDSFAKAKDGLKDMKDKKLVPADAFIRPLS